ncbi:hypothetical protein H2198_006586 [Neophaeococcomyces mojaviensis]|uniref:Uncharacterized protein n=1 Tax=Neophaeococcomyces mojaviensis TaxID=3383035 RepID=A0ACC3A2F2_9EURO|nr:hypothetical protein H2198_006586 [Knufia sp. JES_112]
MATTTFEKDIRHSGEPYPSDAKRGSIYQIIPPTERRLSAQGRRISVVDDIFGEIKEGGPNYRNVGWLGTAVLMVKTQIGLGVLSIPSVLDTLGMGPGLVVLIVIGIITTWSNYIIGVFKKNHPSVYGIDDVGYKLFGKAGREFFAIVFVLFWIFVAGAVLTLTIAVGVQDKPAAAPPGPFKSNWKAVGHPTFESAISACSSIVFAWAGTPAFFQIASEMRVPELYTRSLLLCQSIVGVTYIVIGVVVYYYCGSFVASPALGSAGVLLKKVCYGLALPGLCVSTLLFVHIAAKYVFVRMLRGSYHLTDPTFRHWATWLGCTAATTIISYVIASAIPVFGGLVSLIGALLGTLMCFQPMGGMWLYDNWHNARTGKWYAMVAWSSFVIVSGFFLMIGGTYGSVVDIKKSYAVSGGSSPWSCADNSNSS